MNVRRGLKSLGDGFVHIDRVKTMFTPFFMQPRCHYHHPVLFYAADGFASPVYEMSSAPFRLKISFARLTSLPSSA